MKTIGNMLLLVTVLLALAPVMVVGRGTATVDANLPRRQG